jgi:uncharacterized protein YndB with AHSA1/START domain
MKTESPKFVYVTLIATTPEKLWEALTKPEFTRQYWFGTDVESDWQPGSPVVYRWKGKISDEGSVLKCEPPHLLSYTFHHLLDEELRKEPPSKVTFEIKKLGDEDISGESDMGLRGNAVRLTVTHEDFPPDSKLYPEIAKGWPSIVSNLKTLLETGKPLEIVYQG